MGAFNAAMGSRRVRAERKFSFGFKLICPVQSPLAKIFPFPFDPNHLITLAIPAHTEGRFAIVTDVGHGMWWTRQRADVRCWLADGEVVWS